MTADVIVAFRDRHTWRGYAPGDLYEGTDERVAELAGKGLLAVADAVTDPTPDLATLTVAQLRDLADERGIDVPRRATKAQLVALLEG